MPSSMAVSTTLSTTAASLSFSSSSIFLSSSSQRIPKLNILPLSKAPKTSLKSLTISSQLATLPIFSFSGEKIGETFLDLKSAPQETARAVVHRAIIHDLQNKRRGTASTLTRGEVRGGGKKPYGQKKTGRARMGSIRTPLRPGGGVIFGPKPKDWSIKMNKKEKRLAISTALASATESMIVVEDFGDKFEKPRTKDFIEAMNRWGLDPKVKAMFLMKELMDNVKKSGRNIGTLKMLTPRTLNLFDILDAEKLVLTPETVDYLNGRYGVNANEEDEEGEEEEDVQGSEADENSDAKE
ncbi:50S ribosomal protein L4 chloroplastic [Tripterygium wilfordii]|uniref:Large ribosomal subunit protein uL4c n=1 Tax=Tripterygium wilfordii TaxID=458696 RepID=A0A7J7BZP0_TRIWF|nr:50S ribosomal protein L4, chloroplastic [Tripterygium wilfordii]KAF5727341.1 50S ribosomal protein L4 chloroplastic [Tripterygium wilfordii]